MKKSTKNTLKKTISIFFIFFGLAMFIPNKLSGISLIIGALFLYPNLIFKDDTTRLKKYLPVVLLFIFGIVILNISENKRKQKIADYEKLPQHTKDSLKIVENEIRKKDSLNKISESFSGQETTACSTVKNDYVLPMMKYPDETSFDFGGVKAEYSKEDNLYTVYGKGTTKNGFGVKVPIHFNCEIRFLGGDEYESRNWQLIGKLNLK